MMTLRNTTISLLLTLALGLTAWSILVSDDSRTQHVNTDNSQPDAFMVNIVATIMNKQGDPALKVESPKMIHYPNNDATHIKKPSVTVFRHSPKPWYINSEYALATQGTSQIQFWNNVTIKHPADEKTPLTTMKTNTLTVSPEKQTAQTSEAVTITQPDTIVHAIGMLANMDDGTVKLISQAKGEYVPES